MGDFSAEWLRLRGPADARARATDLPVLLRGRRLQPQDAPLRVLDIGCGTGASLRALAPALGGAQDWVCLDADAGLLDQFPHEIARWAEAAELRWNAETASLTHPGSGLACNVSTACFDLTRPMTELPIDGIHLLTASALIDLVSEDWLSALVERCAQAGSAILIALTYDGRVAFEPKLAFDAQVIKAVNAHQRRDKGFGSALGPHAHARLAVLAAARGYWIERRPSDWVLRRSERALQTALIQGWSSAAREQRPEATAEIQHWDAVRLAAVERGLSRVRVGHQDLLAIPAAPHVS
jgi:SAM-dependent methyltransferase